MSISAATQQQTEPQCSCAKLQSSRPWPRHTCRRFSFQRSSSGCAAEEKITHLLRSTPPGSVREAAACFDQAMLDSYAELAALDALSSMEVMQCQLPLRDGGRGLRSQERLAPAAWLASWA